MKTIITILSRFVAAGIAAVALFSLLGLVPADIGIATAATLGLGAIALLDYSRPARSLAPLAPVLRPTLHSTTVTPTPAIRRAA